MGLFSGEDVTQTNVSVSRVVRDDDIPNVNKQAMIRAIMDDDFGIAESLIDAALHSPAIKFEKFYRYGRDHYHYGLPNSSIGDNTIGESQVKAVIEAQIGATIQIEYFHFGSFDPTHMARQVLEMDYDYDHISNEVVNLSQTYGAPVYLKDITNLYPSAIDETRDPDALQAQGIPATAGYTPERVAQEGSILGLYRQDTTYAVDETATHIYARVRFSWSDPQTGSVEEDALNISMADYDLGDDYFQVMYRNTTTGRYHFWTYRHGAGTHSSLDRVHDPVYENPGTYFPIVLFRRGDTNRTANQYHDTQEYRTTAELMDTLGLDYQQIGETLHDNPDIDDVEQAAMIMAIPLNASDQIGQRYLFEYFNNQYYTHPTAGMEWARNGRIIDKSSAIRIKDADYEMYLSYTRIEKRRVAGRIGEVDSFSNSYHYTTYTYTKRVMVAHNKSGDTYEDREFEGRHYYQRIRKQVNNTFYEELRIYRPWVTWVVYKGKYNFRSGFGYESTLIPIDKAITDEFPRHIREKLYLRSLYFVFCAQETTHLSWYETGAFAAIITIAAIAISLITMQPQFAAAAAAGITAVATLIGGIIMKAVVFNYAFSFIVEQIGMENAFIVAVLLVVGSMVQANGTTAIQGAPTATQLLSASTGLTKGIQTQLGEAFTEYNAEKGEFELYKDAMTEELEDAQDLLETNGLLDPFAFIGEQPQVIFGETPENFYDRTVHSGNIGALAFDAVHEYVDMSLRLPTFHDTVKDQYNG